jgi:hypothetical protein
LVSSSNRTGNIKFVAGLVLGILLGLVLYTPIAIWVNSFSPHGSGFFATLIEDDYDIELNQTSGSFSISAGDVITNYWFPNPSTSPVFAMEMSNLHTNGSPINVLFMLDNVTVQKLENITDYSNCTIRIGPSPKWVDTQLTNDWIDPNDIIGPEFRIRIERLTNDSLVNFTLGFWVVGFWIA